MHKPLISLGVTLPELMITVCISGILAGIAIPSFIDVIKNNRTTTIANQLVTALAYARSEAINRGLQVTIKHKGATARVWERGWDIFTDGNRDGTMNGSDVLLRTYEALPEGYSLRTGGNYASWVAYLAMGNSRGSSGLANGTFTLCDSSRNNKQSRGIIINNVGRVRTETGKGRCQQ